MKGDCESNALQVVNYAMFFPQVQGTGHTSGHLGNQREVINHWE